MSNTKRNLIAATLKAGLASANRGNPFWNRSDAMQTFHYFHKNNAVKGA